LGPVFARLITKYRILNFGRRPSVCLSGSPCSQRWDCPETNGKWVDEVWGSLKEQPLEHVENQEDRHRHGNSQHYGHRFGWTRRGGSDALDGSLIFHGAINRDLGLWRVNDEHV
jgi:hypothetical protein